MDSRWHIELLGRLRATRGDAVVTRFRARRTGALLAYLAFYLDRPHPRELLIELLWPGADPRSGRNNLSRELTSLRRQLEPPDTPAGAVVVADRDSVQLNPTACATDVKAFETALQIAARARSDAERVARLTEAAELYRGELLPGYFEDWLLPERQRLAELFLQALEQLTTYLEQAGDHPGAIQWAQRAVAADPLREEGQHELIRLLQAAGQPAAALRQYQEWERLLAEKLGAAPALETRDLVHDIRSHVGRREAALVTGQSIPAASAVSLARPNDLSSAAHLAVTGANHRSSPQSPIHPPTGTVTFLLAEIGDGVRLEDWRDLLRPLVVSHGGYELQAAGGMLQAAFARASDALAAAVAVQEVVEGMRQGEAATFVPSSSSLTPANGAMLREALHTAELAPDKQSQHSPAMQHATRLLLAAHPGQILVSEKSAVLLRDDIEPGVHLLHLGRYRLRDDAPVEQLFQLCFPDRPAHQFPPPNALPAHEGNLPLQFTRFFGREEEIAHLLELLGKGVAGGVLGVDAAGSLPNAQCPTPNARLVTLTGPGGSGKTRLAVEVAGQLRTAFHGAVWFVPLQDLTDACLIPDKLLDALRLPRVPQLQPLEQATAFLSQQPSLLLLDNFEHLVTEDAPLVQTLLEQIPSLTCLVTSRQRLNIAGEQEFSVAPLPVPEPSRDREGAQALSRPPALPHGRGSVPTTLYPQLSTLIDCASVRLFVDRAKAVRADFQVTRTNAGSVAGLCARLEGLPLAVELAPARAGVLTPQQMLERLSQRFELLASTQRGTAPRHRSLWAALDWSYQLLSPELQRFFVQLSVFHGGWTLEAAEVVCDEPKALAYLEQLRECSLVQATEAGGGMRFRLLETLREYGAEQLEPEERVAVAHRHASYYLALAEQAEPELVRADQIAWLDRLQRDLDNLRAALAWLERSGDSQAALRLGGALREFWYVRGDLAEGLQRLKGLLALPGAEAGTSARAKALNSAGLLASFLGENRTSRCLHEESLTVGRELGDRWNIAFSLTGLGMTLSNPAAGSERYLEAARSLEEGLTIWREIGDPWGIAYALTGLGYVAFCQCDYGSARALRQECLRIRSERGDHWGIALSLGQLGLLARDQGDYEEARSWWQECLALAQQLDNRPLICQAVCELGYVAYLEGDLSTARTLLEQSLPLAQAIGGNWMMGWNLVALAEAAVDQSEPDTASAYLQEAMAIWHLMEYKTDFAWSLHTQGRIAQHWGDLVSAKRCFAESLSMLQVSRNKREIAHCLEGLAAVAGDQGQPDRACRLFGAAAALRETGGWPLAPIYRSNYEKFVASARDTLGEEAFAAAWAAGRAMTPEQAVTYALAGRP